jgi:hypothetical protein
MPWRRSQPVLVTALLVLALLATLAPPAARATPRAGSDTPAVTVEDTAGRPHPLPDHQLPILVIYEDRDAGQQNPRARQAVGRLSDRVENQSRFLVMAVADLEKWNWWPARHYALADLRAIARRENTPLYCDWKGAVRRAWGLSRGQSGFILVDTAGKVRFAGEGPLSEGQIAELVAELGRLGVRL